MTQTPFQTHPRTETIVLPYGAGEIAARLPGGVALGALDVADVPELADRDAAIRRALDAPIGLERGLFQTVRPGEKIVIVVSDSFRQTRADQVVPVLLDGLAGAGIDLGDVSILFATGTHRPPTPDEQRALLGEASFARMQGRLFTHDPRDEANLAEVGTTRRGTRVRLNRRFVETDRRILTGAVVLHYFGGFGGGRKSVLPGLASVDTIAHNHAMNLAPDSDALNPAVRIGGLEGNPVAEDMLEGAKLARVDCIVNTVLNRQSRIAAVFAGELEAAHREAATYARNLFSRPIERRADLVLAASAGTKNFVQTHKALYNAWQAMTPGGRIVLAAPCAEGLGGEQFVKWLRLGSRSAIFAGLRKQSEINGQTALSTVEKAPSTLMVTEMKDEDVALMGARKAASLQEAIDRALAELAEAGRGEPTYYLMPSAAYTVPFAPAA
jgi:nickel-dependent lactate racemase